MARKSSDSARTSSIASTAVGVPRSAAAIIAARLIHGFLSPINLIRALSIFGILDPVACTDVEELLRVVALAVLLQELLLQRRILDLGDQIRDADGELAPRVLARAVLDQLVGDLGLGPEHDARRDDAHGGALVVAFVDLLRHAPRPLVSARLQLDQRANADLAVLVLGSLDHLADLQIGRDGVEGDRPQRLQLKRDLLAALEVVFLERLVDAPVEGLVPVLPSTDVRAKRELTDLVVRGRVDDEHQEAMPEVGTVPDRLDGSQAQVTLDGLGRDGGQLLQSLAIGADDAVEGDQLEQHDPPHVDAGHRVVDLEQPVQRRGGLDAGQLPDQIRVRVVLQLEQSGDERVHVPRLVHTLVLGGAGGRIQGQQGEEQAVLQHGSGRGS